MILTTLATSILTVALGADRTAPRPIDSRVERVDAVREADRILALAERGDAANPSELRERLEAAFREASRTLGEHSLSAERLDEAVSVVAKLDLGDAEANGILLAALSEVRGDLAFRPTMESGLPEGFPAFTPVGEIEVKSYPVYRMARAEIRQRGPMQAGTFWTLFQHIKKHDISMTAPVQMDYSEKGGTGKPVESAMSFLYGSTTLGSTGRDGRVDVLDADAGLAVSVGLRGYKTDSHVLDATRRLEAWLASNATEFAAAGPVRTMEYNSPWVRGDRRYFEVQIPVRRILELREI